MSEPSEIWQLGFFMICGIYLLFEIWRGWRSGFIRSMVRLIAIFVAYGIGILAGAILLPTLRVLIPAPDLVIQVGVALLLGLVIYTCITIIASLLFKRTAQQPSGSLRFLYGFGGAACGIIFGMLIVWGAISLVRVLGIAGEAELAKAESDRERRVMLGLPPEEKAEDLDFAKTLAKLKSSLEMGGAGSVVQAVDIVPDDLYRILGKLNQVSSDPVAGERFLSHPGAQQIISDPAIAELLTDPDLQEASANKDFVGMISNPKIIEAVNDPSLLKKLQEFPLEEALDYALAHDQESTSPTPVP